MRIPLTINVHLEQDFQEQDVVPELDLIQSSAGPAWPRISVGPDVSLFFRNLDQAEAFGAAIVAQARALRPAPPVDPCDVELGAEAPPMVEAAHLAPAPGVRR